MATKLTIGTTDITAGVNIAHFTVTAASDSSTATTIGLSGDTAADAQLPATFVPTTGDGAGVPTLAQINSRTRLNIVQTSVTGVIGAQLTVSKATVTPWRLTITNNSSGAGTVNSWDLFVDYTHPVAAGR